MGVTSDAGAVVVACADMHNPPGTLVPRQVCDAPRVRLLGDEPVPQLAVYAPAPCMNVVLADDAKDVVRAAGQEADGA